jgi:hypothetical protein
MLPCAGQKTEVVSMIKNVLSAEEIRSALSIRDLTDAQAGPHAMQILLRDVVEALRRAWGCAVLVHRENPIVSRWRRTTTGSTTLPRGRRGTPATRGT